MLGGNLCAPRAAASPSKPRLSRFAEYALFTAALKLNNLGWHEVPLAVEHPRDTEKPPGTPSGRNSERLLWRMKRGISTAAVRERENSEAEA